MSLHDVGVASSAFAHHQGFLNAFGNAAANYATSAAAANYATTAAAANYATSAAAANYASPGGGVAQSFNPQTPYHHHHHNGPVGGSQVSWRGIPNRFLLIEVSTFELKELASFSILEEI